MAEVIDIPQPNQASLSREHSSLENGGTPINVKATPIEPNTKQKVGLKKKPFGQRLKETFIAEDIGDVGDYILWTVIVPAIGRMIDEAICGASHKIFLGGGAAPSNIARERGVSRVTTRTNYSGISSKTTTQSSSYRNSGGFHLNEWMPVSRPIAEQILSEAADYLEEYGRLTVDGYYEIAEKYLSFDFNPHSNFTAQSWGWKSLSSAEIVSIPGGAIIKLPNPIAL